MCAMRLLALVIVTLLVGCASSNPPALRRTALLLGDEIDQGIASWDAKIEAERKYYRDTDARLRKSAEEELDLDEKIGGILRREAFVDQMLVEKKGVSLTSLRAFVTEHNDREREADATRESRRRSADQKYAFAVAELNYSRAQLAAVADDLRDVARESDSKSRSRIVREWVSKYQQSSKSPGVKDISAVDQEKGNRK